MSSRLAQLEEFLKDDPNDPFNIYALALEYEKHDKQKALALYNELLLGHENYIPTYYHAGNLYAAVNMTERAIQIFEKGIEISRKQNELKAMRELQSVYNELIF